MDSEATRAWGGLRDDLGSLAVTVAVIDGPYDAAGLAGVLARPPVSLGRGACLTAPGPACGHGTFVIGLLGARRDAPIPGLCPGCQLLHIPLFSDQDSSGADVFQLASAIETAVEAGARLINLSLAILGDDGESHAALGAALDEAHAAGAVVMAAAGNQGRLATGQLLSHSATIPVVAVDANGTLLPSSNLSAEIARRGIAMLGSEVPGYGPGGISTRMSGTSVATAVATGALARIWSSRPDVTGAELLAAVAQLRPRDESVPPTLDQAQMIAALDAAESSQGDLMPEASLHVRAARHGNIWGGGVMEPNKGIITAATPAGASSVSRPAPVALAGGPGACSCGATGGTCTCAGDHGADSGFVYAIGTVEVEYPNLAIEREMQTLAHDMDVKTKPDREMPMKLTEDRIWQHAVLTKDPKRTRYIARQLSWRLTIEDFPAYVLKLRDQNDLDDLIDRLKRPKYLKPGGDNGPFGRPQDLDVIVGVKGSQTPEGIEVLVDQIFDIDADRLAPNEALLGNLAQLADNFGLTDRDRAYNFLAARYRIREDRLDFNNDEDDLDYQLTGAPTMSSRLSNDARRIVDVIFTFKSAKTLIEKKHFVRVDVTHEFPMIISGLQPYLDR